MTPWAARETFGQGRRRRTAPDASRTPDYIQAKSEESSGNRIFSAERAILMLDSAITWTLAVAKQ